MKFLPVSSLSLIAFLAASVDAGNPDCKVTDTGDYRNCKGDFHVNAPGSDVLWCMTEEDCETVFDSEAEQTNIIIDAPVIIEQSDKQISAVEEQVSGSTTSAAATSAAVVVALVSAVAILC